MDDDVKKDPLMGDSSELDAEVADFGKDINDGFDEKKSEADSVVDEDDAEVVDMSTPEPEVESVNIEKTDAEEPKEEEPEEEPVSEIGAAMDEMLKAEEDSEASDAEEKPEDETRESVEEAEESIEKAEEPEESEEPKEELAEEEAKEPEVEATEAVVEEAAAEEVATEAVAESVQPKPEKKKSKKGILIAILILLIIAFGVVCAIMLMPKDNKQDKKVTPSGEDKQVSSLKLKDNSLSDFDLKFLKIENKEVNKIYSPLSIKYALAMLKDGTAGESKKQIEDILGDYAPKKYINSKNLSLANGMFIRDDFKDGVKESYVKDVNEKYAAEVIYDSFKGSANINGWIKNKTLGQISNMLSDDAVSDKQFFLINSLAIDMNWKNMIQAGSTNTKGIGSMYYAAYYPHEDYGVEIDLYEYSKGDKFNGEEKIDVAEIGTSVNRYDIIGKLGEENIRKTVMDDYNKEKAAGEHDEFYFEDFSIDDYISELGESYKRIDNSTDFYFYVGDGAKVFAKDLKEYDGITLQYVAVMPTETGLSDYINNVSAETINGLIGNLKDASDINNYKDEVITKVFGYVPMFNYNYNLNLKDDLKEIGVKDVFAAETADLSNITDEKDMYIMDALHSSKIEFSNEGIKAAATTIIGGGKGDVAKYDYIWDVPVEEIDLTFDKPFLYLIRDKATGEVWFTGTVYKGVKK